MRLPHQVFLVAYVGILGFSAACVGEEPAVPQVDSGAAEAGVDAIEDHADADVEQDSASEASDSSDGGDAGSCAARSEPCGGSCSVGDKCCVQEAGAATCGSTCPSESAAWACLSSQDCAIAESCCLTLPAKPSGSCPTATPTSGGSCSAVPCVGNSYTVCRNQSDCALGTCTKVLLEGVYGGDAGIDLCL